MARLDHVGGSQRGDEALLIAVAVDPEFDLRQLPDVVADAGHQRGLLNYTLLASVVNVGDFVQTASGWSPDLR